MTRVGLSVDLCTNAVGRKNLALALSGDPRDSRRNAGHGLLQQLVVRAEGVENHIAVRKQVLAPVAAQSHGIGKYAERKSLCELFDSVKTSAKKEVIDEPLCLQIE